MPKLILLPYNEAHKNIFNLHVAPNTRDLRVNVNLPWAERIPLNAQGKDKPSP